MVPLAEPAPAAGDADGAAAGPMHWESWADPQTIPDRRRRRWPGRIAIAFGLLLIVALLASNFVTLPYYAIAPGSARRVDNLVQVSDPAKAYKHDGNVLFTTVS